MRKRLHRGPVRRRAFAQHREHCPARADEALARWHQHRQVFVVGLLILPERVAAQLVPVPQSRQSILQLPRAYAGACVEELCLGLLVGAQLSFFGAANAQLEPEREQKRQRIARSRVRQIEFVSRFVPLTRKHDTTRSSREVPAIGCAVHVEPQWFEAKRPAQVQQIEFEHVDGARDNF